MRIIIERTNQSADEAEVLVPSAVTVEHEFDDLSARELFQLMGRAALAYGMSRADVNDALDRISSGDQSISMSN